jgi:hypothetical protein
MGPSGTKVGRHNMADEPITTVPVNSIEQRSAPIHSFPKPCYAVGVALIVYLVTAIAAILVIHLDALSFLAGSRLLRAHSMCAAFGMLGATVAAIRKYYRTLITQTTARAAGQPVPPNDWTFGWLYYYLTRPLLGGVLGALVYTLSFVGIQILVSPKQIAISSEGRYLLFGLSFLSGFAVSHVLDALEALARKLFRARDDVMNTER